MPVQAQETQRLTMSPFDPLVRWLFPRIAARVPRFVTPNMVTVGGLMATLTAAVALVLSRYEPGLLFVAAALVLVNWVTDTLDGVLARTRGQCSGLGDYLDHVFDAITVALLIMGIAFSGLGSPSLLLVVGIVFLLSFVFTYKGEQVTGVYELLALGPTEIRFTFVGVLFGAYFVTGPLIVWSDFELCFMDLVGLFSLLWATVYGVIVGLRYGFRVAAIDRKKDPA